MEVRYFQIILPLLAFFMVFRQFKEYRNSKSGFYETILISIFWLAVLFLAFFPDFFSVLIAKVFGIKDNVNAIIFFGLGMLFYFQFRIYKMMKQQDERLTEISRKIALDNPAGDQSNEGKA